MLETRDLTHRYGDATTDGDEATALDGVSLRIDDGEFVVLVGPNGAGKTTLVRHFNGLLSPDGGEVRVDGRPVEDDLVAARTAVGMVFQQPRDQLLAATVGADVAFGPENLGLPRDEIDRRVAAALDAVDLADAEDRRVASLSGGERTRVAVAGVLAMDPSHLVLDESLSGLDAPARRGVLDRLCERNEAGTSVVLVAHDLRDVLDPADRVVVLADGRVVLDEPPATARDHLAEWGVHVPSC